MKFTVIKLKLWLKNKLQHKGYALHEDRSTAGSRKLWLWKLWNMDARNEAQDRNNTLAQDKGNTDYLSTRGAKGNRWKYFGNQGRQSDT